MLVLIIALGNRLRNTLWNFGNPLRIFENTTRTSREPFGNVVGTLWKHQNAKTSKLFKNKLLNHPKEQVGTNPKVNLESKVLIKIKHIEHNC